MSRVLGQSGAADAQDFDTQVLAVEVDAVQVLLDEVLHLSRWNYAFHCGTYHG